MHFTTTPLELYKKILVPEQEFVLTPKFLKGVWEKISIFDKKMSAKGQSHDYWSKNRCAVKPSDDNICGKFAEFAAVYYLHNYCGFPVVVPDMEVRSGNKKGWKHDLPFSEKNPEFPNCHVKNCTHKTKTFLNGKDKYSWTFQFANKNTAGGKDRVFKDENDKSPVIFMYVPEAKSDKPILVAIAPCNLLHSYNLFKDPMKKDLVGLKKCVYFKDLLDVSLSEGRHEFI